MSHLTDLPAWAAIPVCILLLTGSVITLIGSMGLIRLKTFYGRLHAPTLGASAGTILISVASMITFAVLQNRWILHEVLIIVFVILTTPVTLMLLGQSALYRDRIEGRNDVPRKAAGDQPDTPGPDTSGMDI
ncbi:MULTISPECIES: monovalent cation/H(+) antiporter subunit G [Rhizobium/Agrobacterium group]|uniref:monovalent cation/H(+) antiporter subunit G n=1 Tax=Rhizobium/Agrobacterium group TaxID=227290 RepID=UPI000714228E|nr:MULTISPECIES: monovalent cation/H(+) antiporter subunit G [Rhizobium/Agrobacterium group]KQY33922.1 cation:proton antiporter [Rhizobium sp. Root483D2]